MDRIDQTDVDVPASGQHCPHCGDGQGRERCDACGRNRWIIAFDNPDDYFQAQLLLESLEKQKEAQKRFYGGLS